MVSAVDGRPGRAGAAILGPGDCHHRSPARESWRRRSGVAAGAGVRRHHPGRRCRRDLRRWHGGRRQAVPVGQGAQRHRCRRRSHRCGAGRQLRWASSSPMFGLKIGARGDAVRQLQATLVARGYKTTGDADGAFGVNTVNALTSFQYAQRIKVTAKVDEATLAALGTPAPVPATQPAPAAPAPATPSSPMFGLKIGARGDAVRQLQATLVARGYKTTGDADGAFGVNTVNALTSFQYAQRIKVTAKVDEATLAALGTPAPSRPPNQHQPRRVAAGSGSRRTASGALVSPRLQRALINAGHHRARRCRRHLRFGDGRGGHGVPEGQGHPCHRRRRPGHRRGVGADARHRTARRRRPRRSRCRRFPVQGKCFFGDTWHVSRGCGSPPRRCRHRRRRGQVRVRRRPTVGSPSSTWPAPTSSPGTD